MAKNLITHPITVGDRVRWLREQKKMSQGTLCKLIGIRQPSLSALESGRSHRPNAANLMRIAAALDANPDWIVTGNGDPWKVSTPPASGAGDLLEIYNRLDARSQAMLLAAARAISID